MCFEFTKMEPKIKVHLFFGGRVLFGQVRGNLGTFGRIWAKMVLEVCCGLKNAPYMRRNAVVFFWRSFSLDFFGQV